MKQSAAKTLGVAVLGAAFAAAAAGTASASVVPSLPDATSALDTVTHTLPVEDAAAKLPAGAPEALGAGQNALASGLATAPSTADQTLPQTLPADGAGDPVAGLLGGLPTGALPTGALPTGALPTGAVPGLGK
ncbi:ATP-binding protein [Streptomyces sp. NBC_01465]|uniref:ATP-binding protein n=1 Tax=Streptomyces sp. NBC_01465 TaxID=2903878 RepID=UPI002E2EC8E4|nr:ATP-binding protein [Streptomyces sp. NBC_01465]